MYNLLEQYYRLDLTSNHYIDRKLNLDFNSCQINGISLSGKSELLKAYLLTCKKGRYLYLNARDTRIDIKELNLVFQKFITEYDIDIIAIDNYVKDIKLPKAKQILITSTTYIDIDFLPAKTLFPFDFEEFLASGKRYDSTAISAFLQIGGLPAIGHLSIENRIEFIQSRFYNTLGALKFEILTQTSKYLGQRISTFNLYQRLKQTIKVSKDKLYIAHKELIFEGYLHTLSQYDNKNAVKKVYLCDIIFKHTLSLQKNFAMLFENIVFLELFKHNIECYYAEKIEFYLPDENKIILCIPFADERMVFKKIEAIESFIFSYQILNIECVTMSKEGFLSHPISKIEMIPFDRWALKE